MVVIDPVTLQAVQCYDAHQSHVVKVKWCPDDTFHSANSPYQSRFASADANGNILVWQLNKSKPVQTIPGGGRPVIDLQWLKGSPTILGIVYHPNTLTIVNLKHDTRVWSKDFPEDLLFFSFDPFHLDRACALSVSGGLYVIKDLHLDKGKEPEIQRYHVADDADPAKRKAAAAAAQKQVKKETFKLQALLARSNIVFMAYSLTERNLIYFVLRAEVLLMDLSVLQFVGSIPQEPRSSQFTSVILCRNHPSLLFSVHENGSLVVREMRKKSTSRESGFEISYSTIAQSDSLKFFKGSKFITAVNNPVSETDLVGVTSDGRMFVFSPSPRSSSCNPRPPPNSLFYFLFFFFAD